MIYYKRKDGSFVAMNHKAYSSSQGKAIILADYPELATEIQKSPDCDMVYRFACPKGKPQEGDEIVLLMRETVERFISAGGEFNKLATPDPHYARQSDFKYTRLFKNIPAFTEFTGLVLEKINEGKSGKKILRPDEIDQVKRYYADDIKLYEAA